MNASYLFSSLFLIFFFISCQEKKNNVELTDFTKELISLYVNDPDNIEDKKGKDEIVIVYNTDTLYYYISVFANDSKSYKYCQEDFVGQTLHLGYLIRIYGNESSIFYFVKNKIKSQKPCEKEFVEYDPSVWQVSLHRDMSFCKFKTYKVTNDSDINIIQGLVEKYFNVLDTTHKTHENEVFQWYEIEESPKFPLGEDSLRQIISSNFKVKRDDIQGKIPITVEILVDKNGISTLNGIVKSSNDIELDKEALRIAEIICQYKFIPASHRGENVNATFPIMFLRNDILH